MAAFYGLGVVAGEAPGVDGVVESIKSSRLLLDDRWKELIPCDQWFFCWLSNARGGAFAVATYAGKVS